MEADLVVLDLASTPAIAQAHARAEDLWQAALPHDHDGRRPRDPRRGAARPRDPLTGFISAQIPRG
jgi:hypothetical protein